MTHLSIPMTQSYAQVDDDQLGLGKAIALHLLPGLAIVLTYIVLAQLLKPLDLPSLLPMLLAIGVALIPAELGYLLVQGKKRNGRYSLEGIVHFGQSLPTGKFILYTVITFASMLALFLGLGFTDNLLMEKVFSWWPAWLLPEYGSLMDRSTAVLIMGITLTMLFGNIVGPTIEELYFRGYLLPRMAQYGRWAIVINGILFATYHFWSPWSVLSRSIAVLPLGIAARKGNIYVSIVAHCVINITGFLLALSIILAQ